MQISSSKPSAALAAGVGLPSITQRIRQWFSGGSEKTSTSRVFRPEALDSAMQESLYRLARLLVDDAVAMDLVSDAYRRAALHGDLHRADRAQLRTNLFRHLYSAFQQSPEKHRSVNRFSEGRSKSWGRDLARDMIRKQGPLVRCMIFLRHCESLSLDQIAAITQQAPKEIQLRLLEFRYSLQQIMDSAGKSRASDLLCHSKSDTENAIKLA